MLAPCGYSANTFWSNQFGFVGTTQGAYTGLQSNGGNKRIFIFSVWNATEAKVGSQGSYCLKFGGEGTGYSCRLPYDWKEGHTYQFHVAYNGDTWLTVTVNDLADKTSFILGSIKTDSTKISPSSIINWAEYFEWNNSRTTCTGQPYSQATFSLPEGNAAGHKSIAEITSVNTSSTCKEYAKVKIINTGSIQENGIGNSLRGAIKNNNLCLDASGGIGEGKDILMSTCTGKPSQSFVYSNKLSLETQSNYCLFNNSNKLILKTCDHSNPNTKWELDGNKIKLSNTSLCLTNNGKNKKVTLSKCRARAYFD